jgi:DNA (cytosine-5)-methyltransferase 1
VRVLDLFSGIGGFSLGLERAGMETVAFCEIDPYCRAVLRKHWPGVPIFEDVRTLRGTDVGPVGVICGGFPCQPYSVAGKKMGSEDDRALWPEYRRLVKELRPSWVVGENVIGIVGMELDNVLADLEALGYATRTFDIPACAVGANHERRRVWIVAYADREGLEGGEVKPGITSEWAWSEKQLRAMAAQLVRVSQPSGTTGGIAYGVPDRAHRLKALGNAVVPQIPEIIGRAIMKVALGGTSQFVGAA